MKERKHSNWLGKILIAALCIVLVGAIVWGFTMALIKLKHYGENAAIKTEGDPHQNAEGESSDYPLSADRVLARNTYEADLFYEENGIRYYRSDDIIGVAGIDVSAYQPKIDWEQVKNAGIDFAMIRLGYRGYSTGKLDLDDCFLKHMEGALSAGLDVGVYFFSQALTPEEAQEEAEYVLTWLEGYDINYPVAFDWEEVEEESARTNQMNMLMLTACAEAFCKTVEEAGYKSSVYFNQAYGYEQLNLVSLRSYGFWLAEYAPSPTFAYDFDMWQYSNKGTVPGIDGPVDLNIYFQK